MANKISDHLSNFAVIKDKQQTNKKEIQNKEYQKFQWGQILNDLKEIENQNLLKYKYLLNICRTY